MSKSKSKIRIVAAIIAILAIVGASAMALIANPDAFRQQDSGVEEVEDCDAEDWINREADCGFTGPKPTKTTSVKATPKVTAKASATVRR